MIGLCIVRPRLSAPALAERAAVLRPATGAQLRPRDLFDLFLVMSCDDVSCPTRPCSAEALAWTVTLEGLFVAALAGLLALGLSVRRIRTLECVFYVLTLGLVPMAAASFLIAHPGLGFDGGALFLASAPGATAALVFGLSRLGAAELGVVTVVAWLILVGIGTAGAPALRSVALAAAAAAQRSWILPALEIGMVTAMIAAPLFPIAWLVIEEARPSYTPPPPG
jgi:hypothetical protein